MGAGRYTGCLALTVDLVPCLWLARSLARTWFVAGEVGSII